LAASRSVVTSAGEHRLHLERIVEEVLAAALKREAERRSADPAFSS
jgi:hypothetical protein